MNGVSAVKGEDDEVMILKGAGLKSTPGRRALIRVLLEARVPLTRREISSRLSPAEELNYVSVYRALEAFQERGMIHRVQGEDRTWRYALCGCKSRGHCHPHFICRRCGVVECLQKMEAPPVQKPPSGYLVEGWEYYLRGLCVSCSSN